MPKSRTRKITCVVTSDKVCATLKRKFSISVSEESGYYVECDQEDCQYSGENKPPCPLNLDMFEDDMQKIEEKKLDKKSGL